MSRGRRGALGRVALWLCAGGLGLGLFACDDARSTRAEGAPLSATRLPVLGCFSPVESPGDCRSRADCSAGELCVLDRSVSPADREPLALTCAPALGSGLAGDPCERGSDCESGLCGLVGTCFEPCRGHGDCAEDHHCRAIEARADEDALGPVMACARTLALASDVRLGVLPYGISLAAGMNSVAVPGTEAPGIIFLQAECGRPLELLTVHSNDLRRDLYDRAALRAGTPAENPVLHDGSDLAALMFPNNPALAASASGLTLGVKLASAAHADLVLAARERGPRTLDLNVFYVGGGEVNEPGGYRPGERRVAKMLQNMDRRYRSIGLALGRIRELDVRGALREELSVLEVPRRKINGRESEGRPARLEELFRLSAGASEPAINVFLVRDMGSYLGIAGGIPGVLGVHGSDRSGIALAADVLGDLEDADLVLLHEIAHYMGLFHTTESSGMVLDPLADTPICTLEQDDDDNGELSTWECEKRGAENLMFWSGAGEELTPEQIQVLASSVVLR